MRINDPRVTPERIWKWIGDNLCKENNRTRFKEGISGIKYWNIFEKYGKLNSSKDILISLNPQELHNIFNELKQLLNEKQQSEAT